MEFEEAGSVPLLKLHNWSNTPLPISQFTHGALSASRAQLALVSRNYQAVIVPLGATKDEEAPFSPSVALPTPFDGSFAESEGPTTPKQEAGGTPEFRFSFGGTKSTPYGTPAFIPRRLSKAFLTPYTATPYFTPSATTPLWTGSPTLPLPPSSQGSQDSQDSHASSSFPLIDGVECVAWACCGDEFAANSKAGPFRDILFAAGRDGLVLHAYRNDDGVVRVSKDSDCKGNWRYWGQQEGIKRKDSGDDVSGKRKLCFPDENIANVENLGGKDARLDGSLDGCSSFKSFVVDGRLEPGESGLRLQFPEHQPWPASAKCISFSMPYGASSFSRLCNFAQTGSQEIAESEKEISRIAGLLSNPAQNLVAVLFVQQPAEVSPEDGKVDEGNRLIRGSCKVFYHFYAVIVGVFRQQVKIVSRIDSRSAISGVAMPWTDFELGDRVFVALKEDGIVCLWNSFTGDLITEINVPQFCRVDLRVENAQKSPVVEIPGSPKSPTLVEEPMEPQTSPSGEGSHDGTNVDGESEERAESSSTTGKGDVKNQFSKVTVTADCLLIAVSDAKGIIFLISTDEYFASEPCTSLETPGSRAAGCFALKPLSGYEVAGSDIGGVNHGSSIPNRDWIDRSCRGGEPETVVSAKHEEGSSSLSKNTFSNTLVGASGFTSRDRVTQFQMGLAHSQLQPLRKLFVPREFSSGLLGIALNPYSITCAMENLSKEFILSQNGLRISGGLREEAQLSDKDGSSSSSSKFSAGDVLVFSTQECLYTVTKTGLHVVLPPVASCQQWFPGLKRQKGSGVANGLSKWACLLPLKSLEPAPRQWQIEVLDRCLVFNNVKEVEQLCVENEWSIQLMRLRRLQLTLDYVQVDEVEKSLEALVQVGAAEAGIPQVLLAAVELMTCSFGSDNELAQASRLLELAARFSTRLIRSHGIWQRQQFRSPESMFPTSSAQSSCKHLTKVKPVGHVSELARLLVVIRSVQGRLQAKRNGPSRGAKVDASNEDGASKTKPIIEFPAENTTQSSEAENASLSIEENPKALLSFDAGVTSSALVPTGVLSGSGGSWGVSSTGPLDGKGRRGSAPESSGDMFARWESEGVSAENVVRDALRAGRVPLAVVQLHRIRSKEFLSGAQEQRPQMMDVFQDVQKIGRGIAYEFLCKGKTALAMAALRRLGEEIDVALYELAFGTVRRGLRKQMRAELRRSSNRLGSRDSQLLEITSFLEGLYPGSSFWSTYRSKRMKASFPAVDEPSSSEDDRQMLRLVCGNGGAGTYTLQCGEVDGVVLGSWDYAATPETSDIADGDHAHPAAGYLVLAAVWLHAWDEVTVDRVILDQSLVTGEHKSWGAQLEYHVVHHNWPEVSALLDDIPHSVLDDEELQIHQDADEDVDYVHVEGKHPDLDSADEQSPRAQFTDGILCVVPKVHILGINMRPMCSAWLWHMMEVKLVRSHVFLRTHWQGTSELVSIIAAAGLLFQRSPGKTSHTISKHSSSVSGLPKKETMHKDTVRALHELVVRHCVKYSLSNLLERYLNFHSLALEKGSAAAMQIVVGACNWAQWLLLSRLKGREYDASVASALTISDQKSASVQELRVIGGLKSLLAADGFLSPNREIMAISTLMYGSLPIQRCLVLDSGNREDLRSWQCSMEDLQPGLESFPTLWHALVAACYGHDAWGFIGPLALKTGGRRKGLSGYLEWRGGIFRSAAGDASLLEIMPRWMPKSVRRLLQLSVQGVAIKSEIGLGAVPIVASRDRGARRSEAEVDEANVSSWENSIRTTVKEELFAVSPEETGLEVEHHLRRGRPLAAFGSLLSTRIHGSGSFSPQPGRQSYSYDTPNLLSSLSDTEESQIASALLLAIKNFDNFVVVTACTSFLELCGLPAQLLQVDVAALNRISSYIKNQDLEGVSPNLTSQEPDLMKSLVHTLAEEYSTSGIGILSGKQELNRTPRKPFLAILQLLENASLRYDGLKKLESNAGAWLMNGVGDGAELRAVQRSMSERWSLVTAFCRGHQLPLSTTYLATVARYNDWVGFLGEAQLECCPIHVLIDVASKEFTDLRLRSHILTVLKCLPASSPKSPTTHANVSEFLSGVTGVLPTTSESGDPGELFSLLAECETEKQPGRELLTRAKLLRWPLLAIVASCLADVTPLSCLTTWLELTAARETSAIRVNDVFTHLTASVGAAVDATNSQLEKDSSAFEYDRSSPKRQCRLPSKDVTAVVNDQKITAEDLSFGAISRSSSARQKDEGFTSYVPTAAEEQESLAAMVAVLCEQQRFVPLLRAFELFTPLSPLLPFIRFLQAFAQMRISEAGAHLASFSGSLKDEQRRQQGPHKHLKSNTVWITAAAVAAADAMLDGCPSPYERRCLLQLLSAADFGDGGSAAIRFRKMYWKMKLADPALRSGSGLLANAKDLEDEALLQELENNGQWEEARSWAAQLDLSPQRTSSALNHVTETQAEAMVEEWKELLWDVPEERAALWTHCQTLFTKHKYPPLQAGSFYLKHANAVEGQVPTAELHSILLLALQWLSGSLSNTPPAYPLHLLHELEIRVWLLAVEAEVEAQAGRDQETVLMGTSTTGLRAGEPDSGNPVDRTAMAVAGVDSHLKRSITRSQSDVSAESALSRSRSNQIGEVGGARGGLAGRLKRRTKQLRRTQFDTIDDGNPSSPEDGGRPSLDRRGSFYRDDRGEPLNRHHSLPSVEGRVKEKQSSPSKPVIAEDDAAPDDETRSWEERVGEGEVESAVLALVEVGQVTAARQLQQKLAPAHVPLELLLVEAAQKIATLSLPTAKGTVVPAFLPPVVVESLRSTNMFESFATVTPMQVLRALTQACRENCGRGHCRRIAAVAQIGHFLGLTFTEASSKSPAQLLQLLSLKGKEALAEAKLLVDTHTISAQAIARILAESYLKGLLAAHRGGFVEASHREEGPAPLLWRSSDFKDWAQLCPVEPEVGHALMRLVISGRDIPHSCEVELIILAHYYYEMSACLDGIDVLVSLVSNRVDLFVNEREFALLARLVTGVSNFIRLRFILDVLIEHGCLQLLLQKKPFFDVSIEASSVSVRGFCMAVLSALKRFNALDQDAFIQVYNHFNMPQDMAMLLQLRARKSVERWVGYNDPEHSEEVLESMRLYVEAAEAYANISAGMNTSMCCAQASLMSLQLRMPELAWLNLTETNARRRLVEQPRFQEALIVAEAYDLNQPAEWVPVLWNQMLQSGRIDQYLTEFVQVLPLPLTMLMELARFYRAEVSARGDHLDHIAKWLTPGGTPLQQTTYLGKSMRYLLKLVRDIRVRVQLATVATGFSDIVESCMYVLDKVPDSAGPLILRKGHGGTYIPLM